MLSVIMLSVVMLIVMAPNIDLLHKLKKTSPTWLIYSSLDMESGSQIS
jgi:hypothetical protein